jgi:hypothetical protein
MTRRARATRTARTGDWAQWPLLSTHVALGVLAACAALLACRPHDDIVATRIPIRDAQVEAGPATGCDSSECRDASDVPDAAEEEDAGCDAAGADCGMPPPMRGDCNAQTCGSLSNRTEFCAGARPPSVVLGDTCDMQGFTHFKFAVCTCRGLVTSAGFEVDSLDPNAPSGSASIASNGAVQLGPDTTVDGAIYVSGVYSTMAAPVVASGIQQNAEPQCACDAAHYLDVVSLISTRATDNDNALAQLAATRLNGFSSGATLSLDCGRYYFTRVAGSGNLQIEARGRVAIFIAGDLALDGGFTLTLANGATAEIYVGGNVRVVGKLELSTTNDGNRVLLVAGGDGTIDLDSDAVIDGSIYAPREELVTRGTLELHGSMFVARANFQRATRVHYAPLPPAREMCAR